jgi:hypothetical protein
VQKQLSYSEIVTQFPVIMPNSSGNMIATVGKQRSALLPTALL